MFAVIWSEYALDEMADAMVRSDLPTQDAIENSVRRNNARLAVSPADLGEVRRHERERVVFEPPCMVIFLVDPSGIVRVIHFHAY